MAKIEVTALDEKTRERETITTGDTVTVTTPAGVVYVSYDDEAGMATVTIRGDKLSTVVKFNDKAVV